VSSIEQLENVVRGGGEAGKYIVWELAKQGWSAPRSSSSERSSRATATLRTAPSRMVVRVMCNPLRATHHFGYARIDLHASMTSGATLVLFGLQPITLLPFDFVMDEKPLEPEFV
jgi:hypothetical protein